MASMCVGDYETIGSSIGHTATSWQFALDSAFSQIIDESMKDTVNVKEWYSPLPKRPEDKTDPDAEEYYKNLPVIWGRFRIWLEDVPSQWFVMCHSQIPQKVRITCNPGDEYLPDSNIEIKPPEPE